ncbi:hypothetical protein M378DRAFT_164866 [Amanita muscaria Koide BX008]|uniref:Uncharacterized protein n=1 Tax=Amanita muscaria (strain Koide BX008) TaxID=946122 RepID=A0A0C2T934_AMAMK|nr:hypothetical protein M378DRAFT_164866 [Amanita muscaria Koide BX008]
MLAMVEDVRHFYFLLNICPSQNGLVNLPNGFSLEKPEGEETIPNHFHAGLSFPTNHQEKLGEYTCKSSEGAIRELPEGAIEGGAMAKGRSR